MRLARTAGIAIALALPAGEALAYKTENVFVVVIDGVRSLEAFEDPEHRWIPRLWNDLRPQGTLYTQFYNDYGTTYTTPGHMAMITGQWHQLPNLYSGGGYFDARSKAPTIFEYFRASTSSQRSDCWVVSGKQNNIHADWGLDPHYGPEFDSYVTVGTHDEETFSTLEAVLAQDQPKLVLVNFQDPDSTGHTAEWESYTAAIAGADQLVYEIWTDLIQGDPHYRDKTTMIVTSDHGRHLPEFGDFINHGGICSGDRHIPFLALGPDTPDEHEVTERRYQIDIATTVGELLDFETPMSRGQTLTGMIKNRRHPDPRKRRIARDPSLSIHKRIVYLTYAENDADDMGNSRVYVTRKSISEPTFASPVRMDSSTRWAFKPVIDANGDHIHLAWADGRALDDRGDTWSIFYRVSEDRGKTWSDEELVATSIFETAEDDRATIIAEPRIYGNSLGGVILLTLRRGRATTDIYAMIRGSQSHTWRSRSLFPGVTFPKFLSAGSLFELDEVGLVWTDLALTPGGLSGNRNWDIFFRRSTDGGRSYESQRNLSDTDGHSYEPELISGDDRHLLLWSERPSNGAPWKVYGRLSTDRGETFEPRQQLSEGENSAWKATGIWDRDYGNFVVSWSEIVNDAGAIKMSLSSNGKNWSQPATIAASLSEGGIQDNPTLACGSLTAYAAWEELNPDDGSWFIRTAELYRSQAGSELPSTLGLLGEAAPKPAR